MATKTNFKFDALPQNAHIRILAFSCSPYWSPVSKVCHINLRHYLCHEWRELPLALGETLNDIEKEYGQNRLSSSPQAKAHRYSNLFSILYDVLSEKLKDLDPQFNKAVKERFKCSLSSQRFVLMQDRIFTLRCFGTIFSTIQQQMGVSREIKDPLEVEKLLLSTDENALTLCQRVRTLLAKNQALSTIPIAFFGLRSIVHLDLSDNFLTDLSPAILELRNLEHLDLSKNPLNIQKYEEIATMLLDLHDLQRVCFESEEFQDLLRYGFQARRSFVMVALKFSHHHQSFPQLFLDNNGRPKRLSELRTAFADPATGDLCQGVSLSLQDCRLKLIPKEVFYCLRHVKELDLSYNPLQEFPEGILQLQKLETLNLEGTRFPHEKYAEIARQLAALPALKTVKHSHPIFVEHFKAAKGGGSKVCTIL